MPGTKGFPVSGVHLLLEKLRGSDIPRLLTGTRGERLRCGCPHDAGYTTLSSAITNPGLPAKIRHAELFPGDLPSVPIGSPKCEGTL